MKVSRWSEVLGATRAATGTDDPTIRDAAWVARCVGRGAAAPLAAGDVAALAETLRPIELRAGQPLFGANADGGSGVWIIRAGHVELSVTSGRSRVVVGVLRPGDVEGDIPLLLGLALPYAARAVDRVTCLHLAPPDFEGLLARHPAIARRWLSSVAQRLAASHGRLIALLGRPLPAQLAGLLLDEADDESGDKVVRLPQRTLAAMLGVARPSLNKILKSFERRGHVEIGYASVRLLDTAALRRLRAI
ncbi:Crp/Fnr family transcriptional regulator [Pseudonocardia nigra]|uniref:Crp/Fnr family transcriptional regulator n=1 Tax=Pseudonocardia nigra TaxID=1921578 RepID=UPI001C5D7AA6|nr:Crp/Fnr family transcriptional regulator [Pseudonocardia nigra]